VIGRGGRAGASASIVPRFTTASLTTKDFRWLHPEAWNDEQKTRFCELRQAQLLGATKPAPYVHPRRRVPPTTVGRWLLELGGEGGDVVAAVDAEILITGFRTLHVLVSRCEAPGGWSSDRRAALSLMVSGLIILTKADVVRLVPLDRATGEALDGFGFGDAQPLWTLKHEGMTATPVTVKSVTIDPHAWWESETGQADQKTLTYLEKRIALEEEKARPPRSPKRGFSAIISSFLRWS
jgi:hypothetical protein